MTGHNHVKVVEDRKSILSKCKQHVTGANWECSRIKRKMLECSKQAKGKKIDAGGVTPGTEIESD